jgi:hypothetical protein
MILAGVKELNEDRHRLTHDVWLERKMVTLREEEVLSNS